MTKTLLFTFLFTLSLSTLAENKPADKTVGKADRTAKGERTASKAEKASDVPEGFIYSFLGNPKYWEGEKPVATQAGSGQTDLNQTLAEGEAPVQETNDIPKLSPPADVFDAIRLRIYKSKTGQNYIAFSYCKNAIRDYKNQNCTQMGKREAYWIFDIMSKLIEIPAHPTKAMTSDERAVIYGSHLFNAKFSKYLKSTMLEDLLAGNPQKYMLPLSKDMIAMNAFVNFVTSSIDADKKN
jgi:hypothetical protein